MAGRETGIRLERETDMAALPVGDAKVGVPAFWETVPDVMPSETMTLACRTPRMEGTMEISPIPESERIPIKTFPTGESAVPAEGARGFVMDVTNTKTVRQVQMVYYITKITKPEDSLRYEATVDLLLGSDTIRISIAAEETSGIGDREFIAKALSSANHDVRGVRGYRYRHYPRNPYDPKYDEYTPMHALTVIRKTLSAITHMN